MKRLLFIFLCFISLNSLAGKIYSSGKTAHDKNACSDSLISNHTKKSVAVNFCEMIDVDSKSYAFMILNDQSAGVSIELYSFKNGKKSLAHSVEGLGYHLIHFNSKKTVVRDEIRKDSKIYFLLRVASSPQEIIIGFSINSREDKLEDLISNKIHLGGTDYIYEDSITVLPADQVKIIGSKLSVESKKRQTSTYNYKNGKFRN
jgi:hypothetical protein